MYKATGKSELNKVIDVADYYLCEAYDRLWGKKIYRIALKVHREKRPMNWHEWAAYQLAEFLPPSIIGLRNQVSRWLRGPMKRRIKRLEEELFKDLIIKNQFRS